MVGDVIPFLLLAAALAALFAVFWFLSRQGRKRQEGYAAAETLRTTHVAIVASSVTIRTVVERMLSSAAIPFTSIEIREGIPAASPDEAEMAIVNVDDLQPARALSSAMSWERPVVFLVGPLSEQDRTLPIGQRGVLLSKPFTAPQLFLALAECRGPAESRSRQRLRT